MKKTIRLCAAVLAAAAVFLSACSARTAASADGFQKQAEAAGYKVTSQTASAGAAKELTAAKDGSDTTITFFTFSDSSSAEQEYVTMKQDLTASGGSSTVDSATYNKYVAQNGELYYTLIRMDSTILSCKGTVDKKSEIDSFVSKIKY